MKITASKLTRWAGLPAMAAGLIFIGIQPIHPPDALASTTTGLWAVVTSLKTVMTILGLLGITGIYARQAEQTGWLGLAGYLVFGLFFTIQMALAFIEAVVLPPLATEAPGYVAGTLGFVTGTPSEVGLGALPAIMLALGGLYILGGLLLGVATFRAGVLPRWAGALLAFAVLSTLLAPVLGHPLDRVLAVPMGLALVWLGYALWSDRRVPAAEPTPVREGAHILQP